MKITAKKYSQALVQILNEGKDPKTTIKNLLLLLRRKKQSRLLPKIIQTFEEDWATKQGILKLTVIYPEKFPASLSELAKSLEEKLKRKLIINQIASKELIGGFKVYMNDTLIDASIHGKLQTLASRLNK